MTQVFFRRNCQPCERQKQNNRTKIKSQTKSMTRKIYGQAQADKRLFDKTAPFTNWLITANLLNNECRFSKISSDLKYPRRIDDLPNPIDFSGVVQTVELRSHSTKRSDFFRRPWWQAIVARYRGDDPLRTACGCNRQPQASLHRLCVDCPHSQ